MKITFKLTPKQLKAAKKIKTEVFQENLSLLNDYPSVKWGGDIPVDSRYSLSYRGNLLPYEGHAFDYNQDQSLDVNVEKSTLTYEGQRHPMRQDGAIDVISKIAGSQKKHTRDNGYVEFLPDFRSLDKNLKILSYESSIPEMKWYETNKDFESRLSPIELMTYVIRNNDKLTESSSSQSLFSHSSDFSSTSYVSVLMKVREYHGQKGVDDIIALSSKSLINSKDEFLRKLRNYVCEYVENATNHNLVKIKKNISNYTIEVEKQKISFSWFSACITHKSQYISFETWGEAKKYLDENLVKFSDAEKKIIASSAINMCIESFEKTNSTCAWSVVSRVCDSFKHFKTMQGDK